MMFFKISTLHLLLVFSALISLSNSQIDTRIENFELSDANANHCDDIIEVSKFDGDCCSLNVTAGQGCVLNIVNGRCKIKGQYWSLDWTSTYSQGGAKCPPSEYAYLAPAAYETDAPESAPPEESAAGVTGMVMLSTFAAGLIALVL